MAIWWLMKHNSKIVVKLNKYSSGETVAGLLRAISLVPDEQEQENNKQV